MNRRSSLKALVIISAGAAFLPSCFQDKEQPSSIALKNIKINSREEQFVAELSETIIPKTDTPGASDVSAHLFALMMIDDCFPSESQDKFGKGLKKFEEITKKKFEKSFSQCSSSEKTELLKAIEDKKDIPEDVDFFYHAIKTLTIEAYTTSEYYLTKVHVYKLAPGKFYGCVPIKKAS